jgi:hypothetical protein
MEKFIERWWWAYALAFLLIGLACLWAAVRP